MKFAKAENILAQLVSFERQMPKELNERNFDLGKLKFFILAMGVDLSAMRFVHVAGSKGKGSVCHLVSDYLFAVGSNVGLFTSPHVLNVRERIVVNGEMVEEDLFADEVFDLEILSEKLGLKLTYFEFLFLVALKVFQKENVDFVVLEVGLGGRLDATNIVFPEVACITRIEKEHTAILGESYEEVLSEKLGICKNGVPTVLGSQNDEVLALVKHMLAGREVYFCNDNFSVARMAVKLLGFDVDEVLFHRVCRNFSVLGRFTVRLIEGRKVVFDIAHTKESMKMLVDRLIAEFGNIEFKVLFSCLKDKDVEGMMGELKRLNADFVFCGCDELRGRDPIDLRQIFGGEGEVFEDSLEAYKAVFSRIKKDQVLVVTGSNFLVAQVLSKL